MTEWPSAEVRFKLRYKGQEEISLVRTGECIPGQQRGSIKYSRQERVGMFK